MEVDLQSLFCYMSRDVHSCTHWLRDPATPSLPPHLDTYYEGAIGQQRETTSLCNPLKCKLCYTSNGDFISTLQRKCQVCIPFLGMARPQSQFSHACVCERFIYIPRIGPHISCSRTARSIVGIYKSLADA
jgi:hypothetical protein